jgi:hypothetical protein
VAAVTARGERHQPPWCTRPDHDQFPNLHRSAEIRVGPERHRGRGQVNVYLEAADGGPVWVAVNAAHMAWATVQISLADAVVLRDGLTRLIEAAGSPPDRRH